VSAASADREAALTFGTGQHVQRGKATAPPSRPPVGERRRGGDAAGGAHNELQLHNMCLKVCRPDQGSYSVSHPVPSAITMHAQRQWGFERSPEALFGPLLVVLQAVQSGHQSGQLRHGHMQRNHLCLQSHARMKPSSHHGSDNDKSFPTI